MGEAITSAVVIGAQKIHDNNTNTNNLDFIFFHYPSQSTLEPTQPTSPTPADNFVAHSQRQRQQIPLDEFIAFKGQEFYLMTLYLTCI
jgi:hypothetical protein